MLVYQRVHGGDILTSGFFKPCLVKIHTTHTETWPMPDGRSADFVHPSKQAINTKHVFHTYTHAHTYLYINTYSIYQSQLYMFCFPFIDESPNLRIAPIPIWKCWAMPMGMCDFRRFWLNCPHPAPCCLIDASSTFFHAGSSERSHCRERSAQ